MHTAEDIITAARGWLGTPYRHQASLQHVGCDCLGLIRGVWRDIYGGAGLGNKIERMARRK